MLEPDEGSLLYGRQPARIGLKPFSRGHCEGISASRVLRVQNESEIREAVERLDVFVK
jgi:hypothetical protein